MVWLYSLLVPVFFFSISFSTADTQLIAMATQRETAMTSSSTQEDTHPFIHDPTDERLYFE